jgi:prepilin-type N-terminal cleavage/methylation domain-containing protein
MPLAYDRAFTLIELLIVVAIISVLAAIAVPNFMEAQVRAKVSRTKADLRTLALGLEAYRVDTNKYPDGTDNPNRYDARIGAYLGPLAKGYYTLATRDGLTKTAGRDFWTLTTPIAYVSEFFKDPFAENGKGFLTYSYRSAKDRGNGYILTSCGPDHDLLESKNGKLGAGTTSANPLSTFRDPGSPARLGDINERGVIAFIENTDPVLVSAVAARGGLRPALEDLSYDPTNGTVSDGDIYRVGP